MNDRPRIFNVSQNGEHRCACQGPANAAREVANLIGGTKARNQENLVPRIAKLRDGQSLDLDKGIRVSAIRGSQVDDDQTGSETFPEDQKE